MFKNGPKEKEKILHRLTEKEIKDQLYSFNAKQISLSQSESVSVKEPVQPAQPMQPNLSAKKKTPKKTTSISLEYNKIWQIVLLVIFLLLILFSVRQIVKAIFNPRGQQARYGDSQFDVSRPAYKVKNTTKR